jgi:hypothetical protein
VDGDLGITPSRYGLRFKIQSVSGRNASVCELEGSIDGTIGRTDRSDSSDPHCIVHFYPSNGGIRVKAEGYAECAYYCGASGYFEGLYR